MDCEASSGGVAEELGSLGYYRHPALSSTSLAFTSENDIFICTVADDISERPILASRLTSCASCAHPTISPDGQWVAYSSDRACASQFDVWITPTSGGPSHRLTYEGVGSDLGMPRGLIVRGWSTNGASVLYSTPAHSPLGDQQLALVTAFGVRRGETSVLPLAQASDGVLVTTVATSSGASSAATLFFVRHGFHGSCTRGYRGGFVAQIWRWCVDGSGGEAINLTADYDGASTNPMWDAPSHRLVFLSDRSGCMELWSTTANGADLRRHTDFATLSIDATAASLRHGRVVITAGADLYTIVWPPNPLASADPPASKPADDPAPPAAFGAVSRVPVRLRSAREATLPAPLISPLDHLQGMAVSPSGDRAALVIRGRAFVVPTYKGANNGVSRNRAGRVVDATGGHRGLRLRSVEVAWGDDGLGLWLCAVGSEDGRSSFVDEALGAATTTCETRSPQELEFTIDRRYGHLAITLSDTSAGTTFTEVEPGGQASRAGTLEDSTPPHFPGYALPI